MNMFGKIKKIHTGLNAVCLSAGINTYDYLVI